MPNIPLIQHNRSDGLVHRRRTNQTFESEDATAKKQGVNQRYDRRKHKDRRKKQIKVLLDRRQRGLHRRKNAAATSDNASVGYNESSSNVTKDDTISATIGKHINTTA